MNYLTLHICHIFKQFSHNKSVLLLSIPLILSAFTHLWNPIGFPAVWVVEGQYMHRAMHVLKGLGYHYEQSSIYPYPYDHPYFGQYFLAGMLAILGYPESLHLSLPSIYVSKGDITHSIEMLYLVPKVLIGLLAVLDTFLVYKIAERRYNRTIALIASILFAVMPITWVLRKILLESLLLPLLLSSILLTLYISKDQIRNYNINKRPKNKNIALVLLSGIFLGLAILTKIPVFTMIPLVGYLVYTSSNKNWKILGLWLIPVILMPLSWPVDAIFNGDFDLWFKDVIWNTHRQNNNNTDDPASAVGGTLLTSLKYLSQIEPVLLILGFAGIFFAEIKRDFLILLWVIPFLIFLFIINFVSFFYLIPLIPAFCIAAARMIVNLSSRINNKKIHQMLPFAIISGIGIFGIVTTTMLITTNVTSTYFKTYASVVQYLANEEKINDNHNNNNINDNNNIMIMVGRHWTRGLYWIPKYVYNIDLDFIKVDKVNEIPLSIKREKAILIVDNTIKRSLTDNTNNNNDLLNRRQLQLNPYYNTIPIAIFKDNSTHYDLDKYPYTSMSENRDIKWVEIRANANSSKVV
jgi:hypothetical protein